MGPLPVGTPPASQAAVDPVHSTRSSPTAAATSGDAVFAAATGTGSGVTLVDGRCFCQDCQLSSCDYALELDFEWTDQDNAEFLAQPLNLTDDEDDTDTAADAAQMLDE
jgi:hypothetical protein